MKRIVGCVLTLLALTQVSEAQVSRYIVRFTNKGSNPFSLNNPSSFLSQRAINRRTKYSIAIDSTDLPVTPRYIDSVRLAGTVTVLCTSKWLNGIAIQTSDAAALAKINSLAFVKSVSGAALRTSNSVANNNKFEIENQQYSSSGLKESGILGDYYDYGTSFAQVHIHNGEFLHDIGLRGQGMIIGMLDAGYNNYLTLKAFDSVRNNGQILGVYDFVARDSSVNEDFAHGMECFSTMAANIPGQFVGTAPKANFYLFRTEDASSEYPVEEFNWVCGAERVDSLGGDVISSSLGYTTFDAPLTSASHTYADMNGNTTMAAIGADLAAKKGILVVNAAGNDGTSTWHYIGTPADADSIMTVGAVTTTGAVASFSSYGPSSDGRVKPDVASVGAGTIIQFPNGAIGGGNGTSFACPNIAGLTTCLWQGFPEYNNMHIINALRQAGSKASAPDDRVGYGIPDVKKALVNLLKEFSTARGAVSNCMATIQWTSKDVSSMKYEIERQLPGQSNFIKIAEKSGTGNVFATRAPYQYQDVLSGIPAGTITYRIRQFIDTSISGLTAIYIDTVTVTLQAACIDANVTDVTIAPNPAKDILTVRVTTPNASSNLVIRIFNSTGQLMASLNKSKAGGTAFFNDISLVRFSKGKYYVNVYNENKLLATKELIKL
ncbi:MAG: S8 family serine peptidase [Flavisolibacter sp.]